MNHRNAVVWIDHQEAKIFHFDEESFEASTLHSPHRHVHRHPTTTAERDRSGDAKRFYQDVSRALDDAAEVLVVGPATAKLELIKHVHAHDRALEPKIVGVETVDHPTDGQLVAYARRYFRAADHMRGHGGA